MSEYKDFEDELLQLMDKHDIEIVEHSDYNGLDEYCGSNYSFTKKGEVFGGLDISDIADRSLGGG